MDEWEQMDAILEAIVRQGQREISKIMREEYSALPDIIMGLIAEWGDTAVDWTRYNRQAQLQSILAQASASAYAPVRELVEQSLTGVYSAAHPRAMELISKSVGVPIRGGVTQTALKTAIKTPTAGLTIDIRLDAWEQDLARRIHAQVMSGLQRGDNFATIYSDMRGVFGKNGESLVKIIETDGHRIESQSILDAGQHAEAQGHPVMKQWVTVGDERVRAAHSELNGKTIPYDEDFVSSAGGKGPAPGMMGNASDDINCRCVLKILPVEQ